MLSDKDTLELIDTFRYKLQKLRSCIQSDNRNDLIEAGGLIRDLIISDENGLVGSLFRNIPGLRNGRKKQRLAFTAQRSAVSRLNKQGGEIQFVGDEIDPGTKLPYTTTIKAYRRDEFLKLPVISAEGQIFSAKDIILFVANKLGSRHWDRDKNSKNTNPLMYEIHEQFTLSGTSPAVRTIQGLGQIVVTTLEDIDRRLVNLGYL